MNSSGFFGIVLLVVGFSLLGCKPSASKPIDITTTGQIFIVTKGAENVKLGGVQVLLIEKQQVADFLRERKLPIDAEIKARQKAVEDAAAALATANSNLDASRLHRDWVLALLPTADQFVATNEQIAAMGRQADFLDHSSDSLVRRINALQLPRADPYRQALENTLRKEESQIDRLNKAFESLTTQVAENRRRADAEESAKLSAAGDAVTTAEAAKAVLTLSLLQFPSTGDYMDGFAPSFFKKTVTDADGRFSITYPCGKAFTLYAMAQRLVAKTTEHYCWVVDAPTNSETAPFILSTGNLTLIDPDGYFEHKPQESERR